MKNERHKVRNDRAWSESFHFTKRLVGVWRDLEDNQCWKYAQSSPLQLLKDLKFDLCRADKNELARAEYFWNRRPRLLPVVSYIVWLLAGLGLSFWLFVVPAIGYPLLIVFAVIANTEIVRSVRWRRQYELGIDRLVHTSVGVSSLTASAGLRALSFSIAAASGVERPSACSSADSCSRPSFPVMKEHARRSLQLRDHIPRHGYQRYCDGRK